MDIEKQWKVFSRGRIKPGYDAEIVLESLEKLFKIDSQVASKLLAGKPQVIRKGLTEDQAKKYWQALTNIGLDAYMESPAENFSSNPLVLSIEPIAETIAASSTTIKSDENDAPDSVQQPLPSGHMQCPKCGKVQPGALECSACGIIIARYKASQDKKTAAESVLTDEGEEENRDNILFSLFSNKFFLSGVASLLFLFKIFVYDASTYIPVGSTDEAKAQMAALEEARRHRFTSHEELRALLSAGQYQEVESILDELGANLADDISWEYAYFEVFDGFSHENKYRQELFDQWISASGSALSYLARGIFYANAGWAARGDKWASETTSSQFQEMDRLFDLAAADLERAKDMDSALLPVYGYLISLDKAIDGVDIDQLLEEAIAVNPAAYHYRDYYLYSMTPRWGGSFEEMAAFIEDTRQYTHLNPALYQLEGYIDSDKALTAMKSDNLGQCISLYSEALKYGISARWLRNRAWCLMKDEDYELALADINLSLGLQDNEQGRKIKAYVEHKLR